MCIERITAKSNSHISFEYDTDRNINKGMVKDIYPIYPSIYIEDIYLTTIPIVVKE